MKKTPFLFPFLAISILILILSNLNIKLWRESSKLIYIEGKKVELVGVVEEVKKRKDEYTGYVLKAKDLVKGDRSLKLNENVYLAVIGESAYDIGDIIKFREIVKVPEENTNHGLFNYQRYLKSSFIYTTYSADSSAVTKVGRDNSLGYGLKRSFRSYVERVTYTNLEEENADLLSSVILADYNYIDDQVSESYRKLGLSHLLAVSGLHIGIIVGLFVFILSNLGVKREVLTTITLASLWLYACIIGFPPSVVRAAIMTSLMLIAFLLREPYSMENSCFLAGFIILFFNPYELFNTGFQLSFGATLSIAYLTRPLKNLLYPAKSFLVDALYATLAVQIGIFPIVIYHYSYFNPVNILTNLIVTPIFTLVLWLTVLLLLAFPILGAGNFLGTILDFLVRFMETWNDIFGVGEFLGRNYKAPDLEGFILYYVIIFVFLFLRKYGRKVDGLLLKFTVVSLIATIAVTIAITDRNALNLTMIHVGQGDAIFLEGYSKKILIDTGGSYFTEDEVAKRITIPFLKKRGVNRLDTVILSHFDGDHAAGVEAILSEFKVDRFFIPYVSDSKYYDIIRDSGVKTYISNVGGTYAFSDNSGLITIYPDGESLPGYKRKGNLSTVQVLKHYNNTMLFTGDLEKEDELEILKVLKPVDVLKVGHHGSDTSSSERFLETTKPRLALISVGRDNEYGHPSQDVVDRLERIGSLILRTDRDGEINLKFTKEGIYYSTFYGKTFDFKGLVCFLLAGLVFVYQLIYYIRRRDYGLQGLH
ncbi:MAG: DNA internalization-related competence protein ComEC/Rec2 [Tissierellia bacterium]|nr:DNA internalization-related competence protein ComEC/Rec2 [Tissierellia bacterium]